MAQNKDLWDDNKNWRVDEVRFAVAGGPPVVVRVPTWTGPPDDMWDHIDKNVATWREMALQAYDVGAIELAATFYMISCRVNEWGF